MIFKEFLLTLIVHSLEFPVVSQRISAAQFASDGSWFVSLSLTAIIFLKVRNIS